MSQECAREIELLVKASWRLLVLESFEEDRALRAVQAAAQVSERAVVTWSLAGGVGGNGPGAGSLDAGLQALGEYADPTIFVVLDAHRVIDDRAAVRRLRDEDRRVGVLAERLEARVERTGPRAVATDAAGQRPGHHGAFGDLGGCLLYTSPSPRD